MTDREREDVLLNQAVKRGLLDAEDVSTLRSMPPKVGSTLRYGPRLDRLVEQGKLSEGQLERLSAELTAFERTLDGRAESIPSVPQLEKVSVQLPPWLAQWSQYEVLGLLGQGGMGMVYRARDRRLSREVALKFISVTDDQLRKRFLTEARAQARLNHEFICKVFEVGEVQGHPYIAMELVQGKPLSTIHRSLNREQKLTLVRDISHAVHTAHSLGIIHRDLKPANVMIVEKEDGSLRPVVMDFGLARDQSSEEHLTMTGMVMGTPAYMSPEQAQGEISRIDRRSDVYSLGAMLYELLSGQLPFAGATTVAMILQVIQQEPPPLRKVNAEIPIDLDTIVAKAMAKEIQRRYDTARALAEDLERFLNGEPILARKASILYVAYKRAQKHKAVVAVSILCVMSVMALLLVFVRGRVLAARERERTNRQAALSQQLGQDITQMELFMRAAYMLPAHDIRRESAVVRDRMRRITEQLNTLEADLRGPAHYALGRGHQVLQEYEEARKQLETSLSVGYDRPEVHYTLGLVLGQLYQKGIVESRNEVDPQRRKKQRMKLDAELLTATRTHLEKSAGTQLDSAKLVEGWLHYYQDNEQKARQAAQAAQADAPWDYQPVLLQLTIARRKADSLYFQGKVSEAATTDRQVEALLDQLTEMARSLPIVYYARVGYLRDRLFQDLFEHRDMDSRVDSLMAALDRLRVVSPHSTYVFTEKAAAYAYFARQKLVRGEDPRPVAKQAEVALAEAEQAGVPSGQLVILRNNILLALAAYEERIGEDPRPHLRQAEAVLEQTIGKEQLAMFLWNDLCATKCELARQETLHGQSASDMLRSGLAACKHAIDLLPDIHVGYLNQACLHREEARAQLVLGQPVNVKPGLDALTLATQRKPGDAEILMEEITLHMLEARSLAARKQSPLGALQAAQRVLDTLAKSFPGIHPFYVLSAELLRTKLDTAKESVSEAALQAGVALIDEGLRKHPNDPDLRLGKANTLLFAAEAKKGQDARTDLTAALTLLDSVRPMLGQRAEFLTLETRAQFLRATIGKNRS